MGSWHEQSMALDLITVIWNVSLSNIEDVRGLSTQLWIVPKVLMYVICILGAQVTLPEGGHDW